jgi:hypothetical protein
MERKVSHRFSEVWKTDRKKENKEEQSGKGEHHEENFSYDGVGSHCWKHGG